MGSNPNENRGSDPRSDIDKMLDEVVSEAIGGIDSLTVSQLLDDSIHQSIDLADLEQGWETVGLVDRYELDHPQPYITAYEHIRSQLRANFGDILERYEFVTTGPFCSYLEMPKTDWYDLFGEVPPGDLETWEEILEHYETDLVSTYQIRRDGWGQDMTIPSRIQAVINDPEWAILGVDCSPAVLLDELGAMSRLQAKAYLLSKMGYSINKIAELIEKKSGTSSSHLDRGKKNAIKVKNANQILSLFEETLPAEWSVLSEYFGEELTHTETGEVVTVQEGRESPDGDAVLIVENEDGKQDFIDADSLSEWEIN